MLYGVMLLFPIKAPAVSILNTIDIEDSQPYRILKGYSTNEYWIVDDVDGLIRLFETAPNVWVNTQYSFDGIFDAAGPDANGYLYCTFMNSSGPGVYVIDCTTTPPIIVHTIMFNSTYYMCNSIISPDESKLYVTGTTWWDMTGASTGHPDTGLLWEIDLTSPSYPILDQCTIAALPDALLYVTSSTEYVPDKIFIHCNQQIIYPNGSKAIIDVIDLNPNGLHRSAQIDCPFLPETSYCDLIKWSDQDPLIALCSAMTDYSQYLSGNTDAVIIINSETNQTVNQYNIFDGQGAKWGVSHMVISSICPDEVYASLCGYGNPKIGVLDYYTGALLSSIELDPGLGSRFIYEIPDGRLIVTTQAHKILIIDPT
jgi:hypothetical protein